MSICAAKGQSRDVFHPLEAKDVEWDSHRRHLRVELSIHMYVEEATIELVVIIILLDEARSYEIFPV
jgi:hypothetical protein